MSGAEKKQEGKLKKDRGAAGEDKRGAPLLHIGLAGALCNICLMEALLMSTHSIMLLWRNKKNVYRIYHMH